LPTSAVLAGAVLSGNLEYEKAPEIFEVMMHHRKPRTLKNSVRLFAAGLVLCTILAGVLLAVAVLIAGFMHGYRLA